MEQRRPHHLWTKLGNSGHSGPRSKSAAHSAKHPTAKESLHSVRTAFLLRFFFLRTHLDLINHVISSLDLFVFFLTCEGHDAVVSHSALLILIKHRASWFLNFYHFLGEVKFCGNMEHLGMEYQFLSYWLLRG